MLIEVNREMVYDLVAEELALIITEFEEDLENYANGKCPNVFVINDPDKDIALIKQHIESFKLAKSYYTCSDIDEPKAETTLKPCPICKGPVMVSNGYWYDGDWIWPMVVCMDRSCGIKFQPIRHPWETSDLVKLWNTSLKD